MIAGKLRITRSRLTRQLKEHASELERIAIEGLDSGEAIEFNEQFWKQRHSRIMDP